MYFCLFLPNIVQPLMTVLKFLCWALLAFYVLRVLLFIVKGAKEEGAPRHGMREAMATAYTAVAAYFIFAATNAIQPFVANILDSVSLLRVNLPVQLLTALVLGSACVCAAFICNFSRSLWMLKSLDHAIFAPVPQWAELSEQSEWKKFAEFATRTVAALLFILVEFKLERFAEAPAVLSRTEEGIKENNLAMAGQWGLWLYSSLIAWWIVGCLIAGKKMPKLQLFFYIAGVANSLFIAKYAGTITSSDDAITLLLFIVLVCASAIYMLGYILWDPLREIGTYTAGWRKAPTAAPPGS